jgi:TonB family protein
LILTTVSLAQTVNNQAAPTGAHEQIPIEVFQAPRPKHISVPSCDGLIATHSGACGALQEGTEGWVELGFMVDPQGKPFEITVIRSTGNKLFEQTALKAMEQSTFEPGSLAGKPIESGFEMKYRFANLGSGASSGASSPFVHEYKALTSAVEASDRAAADRALGNLKVTNLYEDAYFGLATYTYAKKWGDESQQLQGLQRAIAEEDIAQYLPKEVFRNALLVRLTLELRAHDYVEVLTSWRRLKTLGVDKDTQAKILSIIEKLQQLRSNDSAYEVTGQMPEGHWFLHLFKRHFQATVSEGFISQVKMRCEKHYVYFNFDPKLEYQIPSQYGNCSIELEGAPKTKFTLVQF